MLEQMLNKNDEIKRLGNYLALGQLKLLRDHLSPLSPLVINYVLNGPYVDARLGVSLVHFFAMIPHEQRINGSSMLRVFFEELGFLGMDLKVKNHKGSTINDLAIEFGQWDIIS